jgi:hypothetical protein
MLKKLYVTAVVAGVSMLALAGSAFAAAGDAPTFSATALEGPINDYASTLVTGLTVVLGVVLVPAAIFTLFKIGTGALRKYIGRGKATSAI